MFTGLIQEIGTIVWIRRRLNDQSLGIRCNLAKEVSAGESIAVNGVCLTVTRIQHDIFYVDVMPQTTRMSNLGFLRVSSKVNLEQAMNAQSRFDGHWVSGHIDGIGCISSMRKDGNAMLVKINTKKELLKSMILRGSIAIDGVSLTICALSHQDFVVGIIPHTALATTLLAKRPSEIVNLEVDILAKYAKTVVPGSYSGSVITRNFLAQNGF